ncbi:NAD-dependent epimerase/dehydratase family protein [Dietzia kunjamensis]|uniref:NAD-dependent epimerase/dehydratase family protein n=1 Tax=Dietzia kunjamensis TaxID=322509 RepID=UPI002096876D|nr:SDR family oxidoreductase [Dietzia kunjamensis]USX45177.1 SDR family oxidoreductase [Dietzia kunjamensis]
MRVLVTGNQGYLGTVVADEISAAGHEVTGLDTGVFAECVLGSTPPHDPPTLCADLREVTATDLAGFDAVVHLAALPDGGGTGTVQRSVGDANHRASVRLARLARAAGVRRFLFASTCEVYEPGDWDSATEADPLRPTTPWAASKLRTEEDIAALADSGFTPVSLRLATAFGYSPRLRSDLPVNTMVTTAALDGRVVLTGDADSHGPVIHVRDAAGAVVRCLEAPAETVHAASFNVGSREGTVTESELARMVADAVPGTSVQLVRRSSGRVGPRQLDCGGIRQAVGFEARRGLADGIAELVEAFASAGVDPDVDTEDFLAVFSRAHRPGPSAAADPLGAVDHTGFDRMARVAS